MKLFKPSLLAIVCGGALMAANYVNAAEAKRYQVTGPVLEVTPTTIVVQKGDDKWEIGRSAATKIKGELKVGARVTIYYSMVATEVEVKETKATREQDKKDKEKKGNEK